MVVGVAYIASSARSLGEREIAVRSAEQKTTQGKLNDGWTGRVKVGMEVMERGG